MLKIQAKQSETVWAKMVNLAVNDAREKILATDAQAPVERTFAAMW